MCSVTDLCNLIPGKTTSMHAKSCAKCKKEVVDVYYTDSHNAFCRSCFQSFVVHKFRSALGKSKLIRDKENVLVAFSGGTASAALLHLIQEGLKSHTQRKLRFVPSVAFIDETGLLNFSSKERHDQIHQVEAYLKQTGFPCFFISLEQGLVPEGIQSLCWDISEDSRSELFQHRVEKTADFQHTLGCLSSATAKEEFLQVAKNLLLIKVARMKKLQKILVADCSTRLSVRILTDMAGGRGNQIAFDTSIGDQRHGDVVVLRPLRDVSMKELHMYNVLNGVQSFFTPPLTTKATGDTSIGQLTEMFINRLQAEFPSTIPNIVRISEKLELSSLRSARGQCGVCQSPLDTDVSEPSIVGGVEVSKKPLQNLTDLQNETGSKGQNEFVDDSQNTGHQRKSFCYGCQIMTKEVMGVSVLSSFLSSTYFEER